MNLENFSSTRPWKDGQYLIYDPRINGYRVVNLLGDTFFEENGRQYHLPHVPYVSWTYLGNL